MIASLIFKENAKKIMTEFSLIKFKFSHPKLYKTIIKSIEDAYEEGKRDGN